MDLRQHYLDRMRRQFPDLVIAEAAFIGEGLEHDLLIVNGQRVFRFPKAEGSRPAQQREAAILQRVRAHVDLPVPSFEVYDDWVTYDLIPGAPLFRDDLLRLDTDGQQRIGDQLGRFLDQLHHLPVDGLPATGARQTRAEWLTLYEDVQRDLFPLMLAHTRTWVRRKFAPLLDDAHFLEFRSALIHADLAQYHILYDAAANRINGVIDFGVAGVGDPALDFGVLINIYGETLLRLMLPAYPDLPALIDRARFYAGTFELQWVLGGVRSKDFSWFTAHLDRARDVQPFGSLLK